ncbi:MAG: hypothetical protein KDJ77_14540, partial [Rhodobiaceae bacterium]|nr:hypothetical protein [Rhodobiaceae bacterium]
MHQHTRQDVDQPMFLTVMDVINVLIKGRGIILGSLFVCLALGGLYLAIAEKRYTATSKILIDPRSVDPLSNQSTATGVALIADSLYVDSEIEILRSRALLRKAAIRLNVPEDPEYSQGGLLDAARSAIANLLTFGGGPELTEEERARVVTESRITKFTQDVTIRRVNSSYVIAIDVDGSTPGKAADSANAVADVYLGNTLESQYEISRRNNLWLQQRLEELKRSVRLADEAVERYRSENRLTTSEGESIVDQTLADLNSQLLVAQANVTTAESKYEQLQAVLNGGNPDAVVEDVLDNPVITRLRTEYADAQRRSAEILARSGPQHQAYINAERRATQIRELIVNEIKRFATSYKSSWDLALAQETEIRAKIDAAEKLKQNESEKSIKLRELQGVAESQRGLYQAMLTTFNQNAQRTSIPTSDARLVEPALQPLSPSSPKKLLTIALALLVGSTAGVGLSFLREGVRRAVRDVESGEQLTGADFAGALPSLNVDGNRPTAKRVREALSTVEGASEKDIAAAVLALFQTTSKKLWSNGQNQVAEVMRAAQMTFQLRQGKTGQSKHGRVIGVASAAPGEGKTMSAELLAASLAMTGWRTLLIDADYRKGELTGRLGLSKIASDWPPFTVVPGAKDSFDFVPSQTREHLNDLLTRLIGG